MQQLEENQRTALAVLLCILVFLFWSQMYMPQVGSQHAQTSAPSSQPSSAQTAPVSVNPFQVANPPSPGAAPSVSAPQAGQAPGYPTPAELKTAGFITVENEDMTASISLLGGRLANLKLKKYRAHLGAEEPLDMVTTLESAPLPFGIYSGNTTDARVQYTLADATNTAIKINDLYTLNNSGDFTLQFKGTLPDGNAVTKSFTFKPQSYLLNLNVSLQNPIADGSRLWVEWTSFVSAADLQNRYGLKHFVMLGANDKIKEVMPTEVTDVITEGGDNTWIGFSDAYFVSALVPSAPGQNTRYGKVGEIYYARVSGSDKQGNFSAFIGPKAYEGLKQAGFQLERSINLGLFAFLAYPLLAAIRFFYGLLGNYGLAVILLTLLLKTLFLPLTKASMTSMKAMQDLQPEIKALRERIKDPTQMNQEMMQLYKKRGVNPMGGCLPMLIQIPVFLGLYNALLNSIEMRHAPFALWINDLSSPERFEVLGIGIPVMVLIMGASMFIQQWTTPTAADPQQKKIMMMMPIIFTGMFIVFPMPAGLVLYWLVNNIISIVQQMYLRGDRKVSPFQATAFASVGIFFIGYVLTLLPK